MILHNENFFLHLVYLLQVSIYYCKILMLMHSRKIYLDIHIFFLIFYYLMNSLYYLYHNLNNCLLYLILDLLFLMLLPIHLLLHYFAKMFDSNIDILMVAYLLNLDKNMIYTFFFQYIHIFCSLYIYNIIFFYTL